MANKTTLTTGFILALIIGIIAAIMIPRAFFPHDNPRITKARADVVDISNALEQFKKDNGFYPTETQGLIALVEEPVIHPLAPNWRAEGGTYMRQHLMDPWGRPYLYLNPGIKNPKSFDVFTYGPTGQAGGTDTIGNWK